MSTLPRKGSDSTVRAALNSDDFQLQGKNGVFYEREPLLREIPEQGWVLASVAGTVYIYARVGNDRYKTALTLV